MYMYKIYNKYIYGINIYIYVNCFCLDNHFSGCIVLIIAVVVAFFSVIVNLFLSLLSWLSTQLLLLLCVLCLMVELIVQFCLIILINQYSAL